MTPQQVKELKEVGFTIIPNQVTPEWLDILQNQWM